MDVNVLVSRDAGRSLRSARLGISIFFIVGCAFATWAARVPAIQDHLGLSSGKLALALLGLNGGAVLAPPLAGGLVARRGSRAVLVLALVVYLSALPLLSLAPNVALLAAALLLMAVGNTGVDVGMNAQGFLAERAYGRPIFAGFHAMFSLGALAGAGAGSLAARAQVGVVPHFSVAVGVLAVAGATALTALMPDGPALERQPILALPTRGLLLAGVICLCAMMSEGVMNDWSAVSLRNVSRATSSTAAAGFAVFSCGMVLGRLSADRVRARMGSGRFVETCSLLAAAGAGLALAIPAPGPGLVGCALLGSGLSAIIPVVFSHAAHHSPGRSGPAIASVAAVGYAGFLAGPVVIGGVAATFGLRVAMLALPLLGISMIALARRLRPARG